MPTFFFLAAICFVVASIMMETENSDALPKKNSKLKNGPSSSGNAEPKATSRQRNRLIDEIINNWGGKLALLKSTVEINYSRKHMMPYKLEYYQSRTLYTVDPIKKSESEIFYYEVKVKGTKVKEGKEKLNGHVSIGLGPKKRVVGDSKGFAYGSSGFFTATGCAQNLDASKFGANDVVGCGVDFANRKIFYTKNGQRFDPVGEFVDFGDDLFPRVSLTHPDDDIEENFGQQEFLYKF